MKTFCCILLLTVAVTSLFPRIARSAGYVRRIIIMGNQKTERQAILNIMGVEKNEFVDTSRLKKIKQNLLNCGLFRNVRVGSRKVSNNRLDIRVRVTEKTSVFIFPIFRAWSKRYSGGLIFGESNLFGENKKTLILGEGGNKLSQLFIAYLDNALFNTDYKLRLEGLLRTDDVPRYTGFTKVDEVNIKDLAIVIIPGYNWTDEISTNMALDIRYLWFSDVLGINDGFSFSLRFEFIYDSLKRNEAILTGWLLKALFEFADTRMGSDFSFNKQKIEIKHARQFLKHFNWVVDFEGMMGQNLPFQEEFTLGGTNLRGYSDRQFRGDALMRLVNEITFPIYSHRSFGLRGITFIDTGLAYFDANGLATEDYNTGCGGGFRVYMKKVVMPLLGLDFAYGIDNNSFSVYFSMGLTQ